MVPRIGFLAPALVVSTACLPPPLTPSTSTGETTTTDNSTTAADVDPIDDSSSSGPPMPDETSDTSSPPPDDTNETDDTTTEATPGPSLCGDGVLDVGEQCDLGLANANDGACLLDCILAVCGDAEVYTDKEECDDANNDPLDGCHACGRTRKVFITSALYQGDDFMGLEGADQRCRSLAAQAGLTNASKFKAWLSDSKISARDRLSHGRGRYELINGLLVAADWNALVSGQLMNPINVTEKSETWEVGVFTSTNPDGTTAAGADHCADWTSQDPGLKAFWGASSEISPDWTIADSPVNPQECGDPRALYCFEQ